MDIDCEALNKKIKDDVKEKQGIDKLKINELVYLSNEKNADMVRNLNGQFSYNVFHPKDKDEVIKIVLKFYQNLDRDFYERAKRIILDQDDDIKIVIYDDKVKKYLPKNRGFKQYSDEPKITTYDADIFLDNKNCNHKFKNGVAQIYIPLQGELKDINVLTHEIAHTFSLSYRDYNKNETEKLFSETCPIIMEKLLENYLLKRNYISDYQIINRIIKSERGLNRYSHINSTRLDLSKIYEEKGILNKEDLLEYMKQKGFKLTKDNVNTMVDIIVNSKENIFESTKYVLASLISLRIYKLGADDKERVEILKGFLNGIKNNELDEVFSSIGLENNEESFNVLAKEKNEYLSEIQERINKIMEKSDSGIIL